MQAEARVIQFVCFDTPLPRLAFVSVWTPFARTYLAQGLSRIVLLQRAGGSVAGNAPGFVSRNVWPAGAFAKAVASGHIGEGGGWPVKATQGGSFEAPPGEGDAAANGRTMLALIKFAAGAGQDALASLGLLSGTGRHHTLLASPVPGAPARFDAASEVAAEEGDEAGAARRLSAALSAATHIEAVSLAFYERALLLPPS